LSSFIITLVIFVYAFSGDRFNPHTAMMRAFLFGDLVQSFAFVLEALTAIMPGEFFEGFWSGKKLIRGTRGKFFSW
jgi:hypothetical protein